MVTALVLSIKHIFEEWTTLQDMPRTFPHNVWVASSAGQTALRRVLLAFSMHKPTVGYCQSMNYITAMLLLTLNKCEEDAFWVLVALIDDGKSADDFKPYVQQSDACCCLWSQYAGYQQ